MTTQALGDEVGAKPGRRVWAYHQAARPIEIVEQDHRHPLKAGSAMHKSATVVWY